MNLLEVELHKSKDFLVVAETLTRVGVPEGKDLLQQCYLYSKQGRYYLCHFNELKRLDGEDVTVTDDDIGIRNLVANLLIQWDMIEVCNASQIRFPVSSLSSIRIILFKDKDNWNLISNYQFSKK